MSKAKEETRIVSSLIHCRMEVNTYTLNPPLSQASYVIRIYSMES